MGTINVTARSGETRAIAAREGLSVMENIREAGIDELHALCGGRLACATCHVSMEPVPAGLPAMSEEEDELLALSACRTAGSRLSCQIPFGPALDGLAVTIAPDEFA